MQALIGLACHDQIIELKLKSERILVPATRECDIKLKCNLTIQL